MGYNQSDKDLVMRHLGGVKSVLDIGSQNDYTTTQHNPPFISKWYNEMDVFYHCFDLAGDNGAAQVNLAFNQNFTHHEYHWPYSMTVDMGSKEHFCQAESYPVTSFHDGCINSVYPQGITDSLAGFYWGWKNQFDLTVVGGTIISVNPKTGNWPGHGYHYISEEFYVQLEAMSDLSILELYEHAACGNTTDGWNICVALKKTGSDFPSLKQFKTLPIYER